MDIFKDCLPSLLNNNNYQLESELEEKEYNSFVVNKALSGYIDVIFYVSEISQYPDLDNKLQYDYYFHSIRKYKRPFQKWLKSSKSDDILAIMEYYDYNHKKAQEVIDLLSDDDISYIKEKLIKGGKVK